MRHIGNIVDRRLADVKGDILFIVKGANIVRLSKVVPGDYLDVVRWVI